MIDPEVFERAAEEIFYGRERFVCISLRCSLDHEHFFIDMFDPINGQCAFYGTERRKPNQLARQLALLFCAEMIRDEIN